MKVNKYQERRRGEMRVQPIVRLNRKEARELALGIKLLAARKREQGASRNLLVRLDRFAQQLESLHDLEEATA